MDVYEGGIRVPFIAYWKNKIKPGQTSDLVSGHWDMYNTFADLSGQEPTSPDGISLLPELLGKEGQKNHPYLYFEYPEKRGQIAVRMGDWKGVKIDMKTDPGAAWELYNLKNDLAETTNLAENQKVLVAEFNAVLKREHVSQE